MDFNYIICLSIILIGVILKTLRSLFLIKSSAIKTAITSGFIQSINIVAIKFVVDYTNFISVILLVLINVLGTFIVMNIYNERVKRKVLRSNYDEIKELDSAISHCNDVANAHKCDTCGENHLQLAQWLKELKDIKKIIKVK